MGRSAGRRNLPINCLCRWHGGCSAEFEKIWDIGVEADIVSKRQQTFSCRDKRDNRRASTSYPVGISAGLIRSVRSSENFYLWPPPQWLRSSRWRPGVGEPSDD